MQRRRWRPRLGLYHVVLRTTEGHDIFTSEVACRAFLDVLTELTQKTRYRTYTFCLIPTKAHLALRMGDIWLQEFCRLLIQRFNLRIQKHSSERSIPFSTFFRLVDERDEIRSLIRALHLIPMELKKYPENHKWSGHRTYLGLDNLQCIALSDGLRLFNASRSKARKLYKAFTSKNSTTAQTLDQMPCLFSLKIPSEIDNKDPSTMSLDRLTDFVAQLGERRTAEIRSNSRERGCALLRAVITWHAQKLEIASVAESTSYFRRDATSIYAGIRRYRALHPQLFQEPGDLAGIKNILGSRTIVGRPVNVRDPRTSLCVESATAVKSTSDDPPAQQL